MSERVIAVVRCHDDLVDGLRARKDELGLSNEFIEAKCLMTDGHADKIMGPSKSKNMSKYTLDCLVKLLAVKLIMVPDEEMAEHMRATWERREDKRVHVSPRRLSKAIMERAMPLFHRQMAMAGSAARNAMLTSEQKTRIARKAARARWRKQRGGVTA